MRDGEPFDHAAAEAEADRAELARAVGPGLEPFGRGKKIRLHLSRVDGLEQLERLFVVAGIAPDRGQAVGCEGDEIGEREPARHVLDIGVQAAVLVDDDHRGKPVLGRRPREVAGDRPVPLGEGTLTDRATRRGSSGRTWTAKA